MYYPTKIIFILFLSVAFLFAKDIKKNFNHVFTVEKGASLFIEGGDGDVNIQTWDKDQIKVDIVYHASTKSSSSDNYEFDVEFRQSGDQVYIIGKEYRQNTFGFFSINYIEFYYEIKVPSYIDLDIISDDGDIKIENIKGDIKSRTDDGRINLKNIVNKKTDIKTQDGDIRVDKLTGELYARSDDGDITLDDVKADEIEISTSDGRIKINNSNGDFFIDSDDGDITLHKIAGKNLDVRSQDGDIDIGFAGSGNVDVNVSSSDGRVNFELYNSVSARFVLKTDDGRIRFDVDSAEIDREGKRLIKGDIGDGEGRIRINTHDGSITMNDTF